MPTHTHKSFILFHLSYSFVSTDILMCCLIHSLTNRHTHNSLISRNILRNTNTVYELYLHFMFEILKHILTVSKHRIGNLSSSIFYTVVAAMHGLSITQMLSHSTFLYSIIFLCVFLSIFLYSQFNRTRTRVTHLE